MKRTSLLAILFVSLISVAGVKTARGQQITVCNKGKVPVFVASMRVYDIFHIDWYELNGWWRVNPDAGCTQVSGYGVTHIVFALQGSNGSFGIVQAEFENDKRLSSKAVLKEICVMDEVTYGDSMYYHTREASELVPPCKKGWKAVPTSVSAYAERYADAGSEFTVAPLAEDILTATVFLGNPPPEVSAANKTNKENNNPPVAKKSGASPGQALEDRLRTASRKGDVITVRGLLARGVNVDAKDDKGLTALMYAANGHVAVLQLLLAKGANVGARERDGNTALMIAALFNQAPIIEALFAKGAEVDAKNKNGSTALMLAAGEGNAAAVRALLEGGADVGAVDNNGHTALDSASVEQRDDVIEILKEAMNKPRPVKRNK